MTLTTRTITNAGAPLYATDGALLANATITFALVDHIGVRADAWDAVTSERVGGDPIVVTTNAAGEFSVALWPNSRGSTATRYLCTVNSAGFRPFHGVVEDAAQPLPWVSFMANGTPLTPQEISQLAQYLAAIEAVKLEAEAARDAAEDAAQAAFDSLGSKVDKIPGKGLSTEDYTTAEKTKLAGVEAGAQVNTVTSVAGKTGAVVLAQADVGLADVDNTSDANKPVSTATQTALNTKVSNAALLGAGGAGLVGYTNSGTGAVATTVQAKLREFVSVKDFGAVGDGVTDDTAAIQAAAAYCNSIGGKLVFPTARYKITGSSPVIISTTVDFSGSTIDANSWLSGFRFYRRKTKQTYTTGSSVVSAFNASTLLSNGASFIDGWSSTSEVENGFVKITTDQNLYSYRGTIQKRVEYNRMLRRGLANSPLKYAMTGAAATKVEVWPMEDAYTSAENLVIDIESRADIASPLIVIETSLHTLKNVTFLVPDSVFTASNPILVYVTNSCDVTIDGLYMPWSGIATSGSGGSSAYTYALSMDNSYDVRIKSAKADGPGWGATGNNDCQRVSFENCSLSRIDFHNPFREYLNVIDCTIGAWGIVVSALGDLIVSRSTFVQRSGAAYVPGGNGAFIGTREDTGGFCDGDLFVSECRFVSTVPIPLFKCAPTAGNPKPSGSPVAYTFWKNINLEHCAFPEQVITGIQPYVTQSDSRITRPKTFLVSGCTGWADYNDELYSQFPFSSSGSNEVHALNDVNYTIVIKNTELRSFVLFEDSTPTFNVSVILDNIKPFGGIAASLAVKPTAPGTYLISNSTITSLNLNAYTATNNPMYVSVIDTKFSHNGGADLYIPNSSPIGRVEFVRCIFAGATEQNAKTVLKSPAKFSGCCFVHTNNTAKQIVLTNDLAGASGTLTFVSPYTPVNGQVLTLVCGFGGSSTTHYVPFVVPYVGSSTVVGVLDASTGAVGQIRLLRSTSSTIVVSGTASVRYATIGEAY